MSTSITCDNCGTSILASDEDTMWWIKVGWRDSDIEDACSPSCAHALIHQLQERQEEIERAVDAMEPSDV